MEPAGRITFIASLTDAITYVVHRYAAMQPGRPLTRTKLVKYLYLCDLKAVEKQGRPLTAINWQSYYYGPFSSEVIAAAEGCDGRTIVERIGSQANGQPYYWYDPIGRKTGEESLGADERSICDAVLDEFAGLPLPQLLARVYDTEPYKNAAKLGDAISLKAR
jgi:hypothetical protein